MYWVKCFDSLIYKAVCFMEVCVFWKKFICGVFVINIWHKNYKLIGKCPIWCIIMVKHKVDPVVLTEHHTMKAYLEVEV
jgi:hypothetical protein